MAVGNFLASGYWLSRLVDQRTNNKSTEVAVINIYCNYLQENCELILDILRETIQTIYDESKRIFVYSFIKKSEYSNNKKHYLFQDYNIHVHE